MALLEQWLLSHHVAYVCTREPGVTPLGIELRQLLLRRPDLQITPLAEAFLFQSDRAQHFAQLVLPALAEEKLVITDRCLDASIAYQGYARGVGMELVERLSMLATQGHVPDLTILLDLDPSQVYQITDGSQAKSRQRRDRKGLPLEAQECHRRQTEGFGC